MQFHLGSVLLFGIVVTFGQGSVSLGFLIGSRTVRVQGQRVRWAVINAFSIGVSVILGIGLSGC